MDRVVLKAGAAVAAWLCALAFAAPTLQARPGAPGRRALDPQAYRASSGSTLLGGVNIGSVGALSTPAEADRLMALARQLHARVVRLEVPWSRFEPQSQGSLEARALAYTDRLSEDAAADGIRIIMMVEGSPCWASSAPAAQRRRCRPGGETRANEWPPREAGAYAAFVAYLARRYGPQLAAIEIWNEPDQANEAYFAGPDKPQRYAALLRAAYPAIKRADPAVTVLGGSLVGSNGAFLRALYAAGIKGYYDGLAVHFYNLTLGSVRAIHEVQLAHGDHTPLWLDEFGWTSCWPRQKVEQEQACVTAAVQAQNIANTFRLLARAPYVAAAVIYKLQDSADEDFGVLARSGAHKPSFGSLAGVLASPLGSVSPVTLSLGRRGSQVLASGSGPVGDFMELEAFQGATLRYRALFTLNRFNRYSLRLPAALGTSGLRVRVYQYWSGLAGDAQKTI
ncbi:MAG TPA: glycosyl hydrolase [Solirubrobacteraceae bacterium]|jgi:hypothetical protein|nr:glycosyl hydrolase [Solirubrobacteraceae bacterium]